jgi:hypothetical protein
MNTIFIDIDTESETVEVVNVAFGGRNWCCGDVLREPGMR